MNDRYIREMINFPLPEEREQPQSYTEFPFEERHKYNLVQCVGRGVMVLTDEEMQKVERLFKDYPTRVVGINGARILHINKRNDGTGNLTKKQIEYVSPE